VVGAQIVSVARDEVLSRVRGAILGASAPPPGRDYRRTGELDPEARVDLLCERIADYRAEVRRIAYGEVSAAVAAALAGLGATRVGVPAGLPGEWLPPGLEAVVDDGLSATELDRLDAVVTGCTLAVAETGTLILCGGPEEGRRALTLVPDVHICVVRESRVVELVPEAISTLTALGSDRRPLTFISGPSATSDIELSRVEGVHGPRTLVVLVAKEPA
jgi:L-lactate dehydrogenase complex protein LldG